MYEELVKRLKESCYNCKLWDGYKCYLKGECTAQTRLEAADAIEELSRLHEAQRQNLLALLNEKPETEWIPVTERLPEVGFDVLTWENSVMNVSFLFGNGRWFNAVQPSHWMPLPEPPTADNGK